MPLSSLNYSITMSGLRYGFKFYFYLISEQEILKDELKALQVVNARLKQKISELEEDLKKSKEEMDKHSKSNKSDDEVFILFLLS